MRKFSILLGLAAAAVALSAQAQPNGVTVEMELGQDQFLPDEAVPVKVTIVNRSGQPVVLGTTTNWITFDVLGEHQKFVHKLGEMPVKSPFSLLSGQTVTREFNPTPYFEFRRPGRYVLRAGITVPQWKKEIPCRPVAFSLIEGLPVPGLGDLMVGVPAAPGATNTAPDVRHYSLLKVSYPDQIKLYFRLTDSDGSALRVFPLSRMVDFREPEAQTDRANNLHVLFQTGAKTFTYCVLDPNGNWLARQYYQYVMSSRPDLRLGDDGQISVGGGQRRLTEYDIPAPPPSTARSQ